MATLSPIFVCLSNPADHSEQGCLISPRDTEWAQIFNFECSFAPQSSWSWQQQRMCITVLCSGDW